MKTKQEFDELSEAQKRFIHVMALKGIGVCYCDECEKKREQEPKPHLN